VTAAVSIDRPVTDGARPLVTVRGVSKQFANGTIAVRDVNLDLAAGEFVSLLGPSGCGKSTALRIIAGLAAASTGTVELAHHDVERRGSHRIGFVFQEPTLMPWATVRDNVRLPLKLARTPAAEADARIDAALDQVGLADFASAYPRELSGGMKMRVSLARALVTDPDILLMDEPFAALDEITRFRLNNDLLALWRNLHSTGLRDALRVRVGLSLAARDRDDGAAGPDRRRVSHHLAGAARRGIPHVGRICRILPRGLGRAGAVLCGADRRMKSPQSLVRFVLPVAVFAAGLVLWEAIVRINGIQPYVLPSPLLVLKTLVADWPMLSQSLGVTLLTTLEGFVAAAVGGVVLALLFNQSKWLEYSLFPYAVVLQVTPVIAIAPLLLIYLQQQTAVIVCAWIVAFFPVLSNTTLGLNSVDRNLAGLFQLYGASKVQTLLFLKLPAALPYILGGLRIAGGLSLIGAVVAEIAAGSAGAGSGLAYRIAESGYRLNIPRMFAALIMISMSGIAIFLATSWLSHMLLRRWHESALKREN
jgi:NitT/TauT family transport system permease protein